MAKRAVIIHGLQSNSQGNWFQWLKAQLENYGYEVWVPDMPGADHPSATKWAKYLLSSSWDFNESLVIGHSAGAVAALVLAQMLPDKVRLKGEVLVSAFNPVKPQNEYYNDLKDLHDTPFDFAKIQANVDELVFVHGNDDPWAPYIDGQDLAKKTNSPMVMIPYGQHFSVGLDPVYKEFPKLMEIIEQYKLL